METSLKTGFAQVFSCCPKNLSCPKFGGAAAPLAPPARTPMCISSRRCFDDQPNEIYRHLSKMRHKAGFLGPIGSKITPTKEKERRRESAGKKKGGEEKKAMVALLA